MNLSPRQLRIFVLLADTLSFHKAAARLHVTQPTLSKLVKEMEDTIGMRLFERNTRVVRLTRDGQDLLALARKTVEAYESGLHAFEQMVRHRRDRVAIAALPTLAATLLPRLIVALEKVQPGVRVSVFDLVADEALALLRSRRVDLALTAMDAMPPDLACTELFQEPFVLLHSACQRVGLSGWDAQALAAMPLISMPEGTSTREIIEAEFAKARVLFAPHFVLRDLNTIARFAQAGCGIALLPRSAVEPFLSPELRVTYIEGAPRRSIGIVMRRETEQPPLVERVVEVLRQLVREKRDGPGRSGTRGVSASTDPLASTRPRRRPAAPGR